MLCLLAFHLHLYASDNDNSEIETYILFDIYVLIQFTWLTFFNIILYSVSVFPASFFSENYLQKQKEKVNKIPFYLLTLPLS